MKNREYYAAEIDRVKRILSADPENKKLKSKLHYRIGKFVDLSDIVVLVAGNEQKPWTSQELGFRTSRMPQKSEIGYEQVGDYQYTLNGEIGSLVIERKEVLDFYGTMFNSENRDRFYREIDRFYADHRFDNMVVIVEGTLMEFLWYEPPKRQLNKYKKVTADQKLATVAGLFQRGVPVMFAESRHLAAQMCRYLIRQNAIRKIRDTTL